MNPNSPEVLGEEFKFRLVCPMPTNASFSFKGDHALNHALKTQ